ncbi:DUF4112 domain-containing protein [Sphingomonas canadensis]|uniref:DUF4112 domain-containing protein n=1 Tax=Sphingomonas canadensis TaxID=1219257 RepID=A0ABW3H9V0_9SPHN|nr:DUF4112 domain-containing protein [Sphingomonas canadensis]MCW3836151.1 DUF4112 domain-containing protein [Sphingomonas canadensis]
MAKTTRMPRNAMGNMLGRDAAAVRRRVEAMEQLLERTFVIPGINRPIGLDVFLDFIPVGGTFIGAILGLYMVWEARNLKMGGSAVMRMVGNVAVDWALGLIPGIGIIPDFFFRSNSRNLKIIRKHLDRHHPATATVQHK